MATFAELSLRVALSGVVPDDDPHIIADMQERIAEYREENKRLRVLNADMLALLKAMSEAYENQPICAWFGAIRAAIVKAEAAPSAADEK